MQAFELLRDVATAILPPVRVPLSEWANEHVRLSSEGSVQPGHWQCFPYQVEPLDAMISMPWSTQNPKAEIQII